MRRFRHSRIPYLSSQYEADQLALFPVQDQPQARVLRAPVVQQNGTEMKLSNFFVANSLNEDISRSTTSKTIGTVNAMQRMR
jgi:hypothetical protein